MTLLQQRDLSRQMRRLKVCEETRKHLREALAELIPGQTCVLFGSLVKPGVFNDRSDIDLALFEEPARMNSWQLGSALMQRLDRPVDVVILDRCRFREKILREGEVWTA